MPQKRATQPGQPVSKVLTTMLLNGIKNKHKASNIVALDFGRGVAVVEPRGGDTARACVDATHRRCDRDANWDTGNNKGIPS